MVQEDAIGASLCVIERRESAGCSKWPFSKAAASEGPKAYSLGYVEGLNDARTPYGKRRVLARLGWAGEKSAIFNSLLQLLHDPFDIASELHIALSVNRFPLCGAGCLDGAFPIGHLCTAFRGEFLISHAGNEFE